MHPLVNYLVIWGVFLHYMTKMLPKTKKETFELSFTDNFLDILTLTVPPIKLRILLVN